MNLEMLERKRYVIEALCTDALRVKPSTQTRIFLSFVRQALSRGIDSEAAYDEAFDAMCTWTIETLMKNGLFEQLRDLGNGRKAVK